MNKLRTVIALGFLYGVLLAGCVPREAPFDLLIEYSEYIASLEAGFLVSVIATVVAVVGLFVAIIGLRSEIHRHNKAVGLNLLRDLQKEFDYSLRGARLSVATELKEQFPEISVMPGQATAILDFFDIMGMYLNEGVIEDDMTWNTFYWWLSYYWHFLKDAVSLFEEMNGGTEYYKHLYDLYPRMTKYGEEHRKLNPSKHFEDEKLLYFLEIEIKECSVRGADSSA